MKGMNVSGRMAGGDTLPAILARVLAKYASSDDPSATVTAEGAGALGIPSAPDYTGGNVKAAQELIQALAPPPVAPPGAAPAPAGKGGAFARGGVVRSEKAKGNRRCYALGGQVSGSSYGAGPSWKIATGSDQPTGIGGGIFGRIAQANGGDKAAIMAASPRPTGPTMTSMDMANPLSHPGTPGAYAAQDMAITSPQPPPAMPAQPAIAVQPAGGALGGAPKPDGCRCYALGGRVVRGPGDGRSDSVPAMVDDGSQAALSDGEYVIPADAVSALGKGSTDAGVRKLDALVGSVRAGWSRKVGALPGPKKGGRKKDLGGFFSSKSEAEIEQPDYAKKIGYFLQGAAEKIKTRSAEQDVADLNQNDRDYLASAHSIGTGDPTGYFADTGAAKQRMDQAGSWVDDAVLTTRGVRPALWDQAARSDADNAVLDRQQGNLDAERGNLAVGQNVLDQSVGSLEGDKQYLADQRGALDRAQGNVSNAGNFLASVYGDGGAEDARIAATLGDFDRKAAIDKESSARQRAGRGAFGARRDVAEQEELSASNRERALLDANLRAEGIDRKTKAATAAGDMAKTSGELTGASANLATAGGALTGRQQDAALGKGTLTNSAAGLSQTSGNLVGQRANLTGNTAAIEGRVMDSAAQEGNLASQASALAKDRVDVTQAQRDASIQNAGLLRDAGTYERAQDQAVLDAPYKRLNAFSTAISGAPSATSTTSSPSPFQLAGGLAMTAGSLFMRDGGRVRAGGRASRRKRGAFYADGGSVYRESPTQAQRRRLALMGGDPNELMGLTDLNAQRAEAVASQPDDSVLDRLPSLDQVGEWWDNLDKVDPPPETSQAFPINVPRKSATDRVKELLAAGQPANPGEAAAAPGSPVESVATANVPTPGPKPARASLPAPGRARGAFASGPPIPASRPALAGAASAPIENSQALYPDEVVESSQALHPAEPGFNPNAMAGGAGDDKTAGGSGGWKDRLDRALDSPLFAAGMAMLASNNTNGLGALGEAGLAAMRQRAGQRRDQQEQDRADLAEARAANTDRIANERLDLEKSNAKNLEAWRQSQQAASDRRIGIEEGRAAKDASYKDARLGQLQEGLSISRQNANRLAGGKKGGQDATTKALRQSYATALANAHLAGDEEEVKRIQGLLAGLDTPDLPDGFVMEGDEE